MIVQEAFFMNIPTHMLLKKISPFVIATESGRTIRTKGKGKEILVVKSVVHTTEV